MIVSRHTPPERVVFETLNATFRGQTFGVTTGSIAVCAFGLLAGPLLPAAVFVPWLASMVILMGARAVLGAVYTSDHRLRSAPALAGALQEAMFALTGVCWSWLGMLIIIHRPDHVELVYLIFMYLMVRTSHAITTTPFLMFGARTIGLYVLHVGVYFLAAMSPSILAALMLDETQYGLALAAGLLFFLGALVSGPAKVYESVRGDFHRFDLINSFTEHSGELERAHKSLAEQKDALDHANQAKAQFLAAASHDLRQPMQAISMHVARLEARIGDRDGRELLASLLKAVRAMESLFSAILDLSRFDAGTVKPATENFPLSIVLDQVCSEFREQGAADGTRISMHSCRCIVRSDPTLLLRIVLNLASNAMRYARGRRVIIGCRRRAASVEIQVLDTGPGIPEGAISDIFREFYQLDAGNTGRHGLGLGLAIVDRTAKLLGHRVRVRSRLGAGSMFSVEIPYADEPFAPEIEPSPVAPVSLEGCVVLVVDDDGVVRNALGRILEDWGCRVLFARDVASAVACVTCTAPHLVLSDFRLPNGETGLDVIRHARRLSPGVAGVVLSGDIAPETLRDVASSGYPLLHKPVGAARLRRVLSDMLRPRPLG